uniref:Uncharacterized protein n=1 Tax=Picea sitchensis TaxID=3332 RepID=A0A6B9XWL6_PICSI|nr:hypothetical protein Q903MT_gene5490 [Picea sitchensis]
MRFIMYANQDRFLMYGLAYDLLFSPLDEISQLDESYSQI